MNKEEYYKRIERINNRFKTDRVSADEEYQLVCQKNYLSTKYIENLEQQVKKQKEVIDKIYKKCQTKENKQMCVKLNDEWHALVSKEEILDILKEASE